MDKSREQFEHEINKKFGDLIDQRVCKNSDGDYMAWDMQVAWWAWQASRAALCPKCGGTGMADSGGVQPWGEPIEIPCDCPFGDNK